MAGHPLTRSLARHVAYASVLVLATVLALLGAAQVASAHGSSPADSHGATVSAPAPDAAAASTGSAAPTPESGSSARGQDTLRDLIWIASAGLALVAGIDTIRRHERRSATAHPSAT